MSEREEWIKWMMDNPTKGMADFRRMKDERKQLAEEMQLAVIEEPAVEQPIQKEVEEQITSPEIDLTNQKIDLTKTTVPVIERDLKDYHLNKNIWGAAGKYAGQYKRHAVDKDVDYFIGWKKLDELFCAFKTRELEGFDPKVKREQHKYCDVVVVAFKLATRITEALQTRAEWFTVFKDDGLIMVKDFPILKRWKALDKSIKCGRCGHINDKFEGVCVQCGANLLIAGKKVFETKHLDAFRRKFFIKINEKYSDKLIEIIEEKKTGLLFPSPDCRREGRPYTRGWAYSFVKNYGEVVGMDKLYNHYFRAQRLMLLNIEMGYTRDDLKMFTGIIEDKTLDHYIKNVQSYVNKLIPNISTERLAEMMGQPTSE